MLRKHGQKGAALVLAALLGGCTSLFDSREWTFPDSGSGGMFRAAWGGMGGNRAEDSETIRRVRGVEAPLEPLQLEPGNVWPVEEAPRATLANPDAALRGVPAYRPGDGRDSDGRQRDPATFRDPAPRADLAPPRERRPQDGPRRRGASSQPPLPFEQPETERVQVLPVPPGANSPPPRRFDGQVVLPPGGPPVTTTGGTDRIQGFTTPGGGGGVIHRDGGFTTISPSGGIPQTFPTPR